MSQTDWISTLIILSNTDISWFMKQDINITEQTFQHKSSIQSCQLPTFDAFPPSKLGIVKFHFFPVMQCVYTITCICQRSLSLCDQHPIIGGVLEDHELICL